MNREKPDTLADSSEPTVHLEATIGRSSIIGPAGTLKLHPDDTLMRDLLLLVLHETGDVPLKELLKLFGYNSRATYYAKRKRYREGGVPALLHRRPGPRHKWKRSRELIERVVNMRRQNPQRSARDIADTLQRQGVDVSLRSVERTLAEEGLSQRSG